MNLDLHTNKDWGRTRHADWRAPWHRRVDYDRDAVSDHLPHAGGAFDHHAGRRFLRSTVFFTRPISLVFVIATGLIAIAMIWPAVRERGLA
jgi:hypothetical protein